MEEILETKIGSRAIRKLDRNLASTTAKTLESTQGKDGDVVRVEEESIHFHFKLGGFVPPTVIGNLIYSIRKTKTQRQDEERGSTIETSHGREEGAH